MAGREREQERRKTINTFLFFSLCSLSQTCSLCFQRIPDGLDSRIGFSLVFLLSIDIECAVWIIFRIRRGLSIFGDCWCHDDGLVILSAWPSTLQPIKRNTTCLTREKFNDSTIMSDNAATLFAVGRRRRRQLTQTLRSNQRLAMN